MLTLHDPTTSPTPNDREARICSVMDQLRPAADGRFAVALRLDATTAFRLNAGGLTGPALTVRFTA